MTAEKDAARFEYLRERLESLRQSASLRTLSPRSHAGLSIIEPDGRELINFGSNDYLGLAAHSRLDDLDLATGAGASALVSGFTMGHQQLCDALASLEQTEAAMVFPSGYAACSGTVATLAEEGDLLLSDELNHASLIDGCRLSKANRFIFAHGDSGAVKHRLEKERGRYLRAWIVTDGVFGMDGDVAPLNELCELAERFDANLIVDEAHATGVLGDDGSGLCAELGVKSRVAIRVGTLSKAIGSHGGFVVGPRAVVDYLINRCRPLVFSTAGSPLTIHAAKTAIESFSREPERRQRVRLLAAGLRSRLEEMLPGRIPCTRVTGVPIIPIIVGSNATALRVSAELRLRGFFVPAIRPPTVPDGTARLRVSLSAAHLADDVDRLGREIIEIVSSLG